MVFHFNIDYKTVYGEELVLNMTVDGKEVQYKMGTEDGSRRSFDWDGTPKSPFYTGPPSHQLSYSKRVPRHRQFYNLY